MRREFRRKIAQIPEIFCAIFPKNLKSPKSINTCGWLYEKINKNSHATVHTFQGIVSQDFLVLVFASNSFSWDQKKYSGTIVWYPSQWIGGLVVYDTLQNGDSVVYDTPLSQ